MQDHSPSKATARPAHPPGVPRGARLARFVATAGGAGYSPQSPGTAGALVGVPIAYALHDAPLWGFALATAILFVVGTWGAAGADRFWNTHDSQRIVVDELVGFLVTVAVFDCSDWVVLGLGFGLFRLFDIVKPWPIRLVDQKLGGALGVMLDDVAAGAVAALILGALVAAGAVPWFHAVLW